MIEYKISKLGNILKVSNGSTSLLNMDEKSEDFKNYLNYLKNNGIVESSNLISEEEKQEIIKLKIEQLNIEQNLELQKTDWYFTREMDTGKEVPPHIKEERLKIREKYNNLIDNICL
mgnify:CR=1 FL=1